MDLERPDRSSQRQWHLALLKAGRRGNEDSRWTVGGTVTFERETHSRGLGDGLTLPGVGFSESPSTSISPASPSWGAFGFALGRSAYISLCEGRKTIAEPITSVNFLWQKEKDPSPARDADKSQSLHSPFAEPSRSGAASLRKREAEGRQGLSCSADTETCLCVVLGSHQALHLIWRLEATCPQGHLSFSGGQAPGHAHYHPLEGYGSQ